MFLCNNDNSPHKVIPYLISVYLLLSLGTSAAIEPLEHQEEDCNSCHNHHQNPPPNQDQVCLGCHSTTLNEADYVAGAFHDPADRACSRCHGYHATEMLKATDLVFERPFQEQEVLNQCRNCHRENLVVQSVSVGHLQAARQYHVNAAELYGQSPSEICLRCHDQDSGYGVAPSETPTFPVHGSHPIGIAIPISSPWEASGFQPVPDPSLELVNQTLQCGTCHSLASETVFRLVPFPTATDLCNGCHDMAPGLNSKPGPEKMAMAATS